MRHPLPRWVQGSPPKFFACLKSTSYAHFLSESIVRISNTEQPSCIDWRLSSHDHSKWPRPYEHEARRHLQGFQLQRFTGNRHWHCNHCNFRELCLSSSFLPSPHACCWIQLHLLFGFCGRKWSWELEKSLKSDLSLKILIPEAVFLSTNGRRILADLGNRTLNWTKLSAKYCNNCA